jgi:hypothetical protein
MWHPVAVAVSPEGLRMRAIPWLVAVFWSLPAVAVAPVGSWRDLRTAAEQRVAQLKQRYPEVDASWRPSLPGPELVTGLDVLMPGESTPEGRARAFLSSQPDLLGIDVGLLHRVDETRAKDRVIVHFAQWAQTPAGPRPVLDRLVAVTMDTRGHILTLASDALPTAEMPPATLSAAEAQAVVVREVLANKRPPKLPAVLAVWAEPGRGRLVWVLDAGLQRVVVDAVTGAIAARQSRVVP